MGLGVQTVVADLYLKCVSSAGPVGQAMKCFRAAALNTFPNHWTSNFLLIEKISLATLFRQCYQL